MVWERLLKQSKLLVSCILVNTSCYPSNLFCRFQYSLHITVEEEKKEKEKEMLRGLEERASADAKWIAFTKNAKKDEDPIAVSGNVRNENTTGVG